MQYLQSALWDVRHPSEVDEKSLQDAEWLLADARGDTLHPDTNPEDAVFLARSLICEWAQDRTPGDYMQRYANYLLECVKSQPECNDKIIPRDDMLEYLTKISQGRWPFGQQYEGAEIIQFSSQS